MAVEIKEIVVKAIIPDGRTNQKVAGPGDTSTGKKSREDQQDAPAAGDLVQTCVDQVLKILEKRKLR